MFMAHYKGTGKHHIIKTATEICSKVYVLWNNTRTTKLHLCRN